jgi:hypothetical protein
MSIDLRELMQERAAVADLAPTGDRLGAVHRRIGQVRRRRTAGVVAGVCVLVAAITVGALNMPVGRDNSAPQPGTTATSIDGFAEYSFGGRVIATAVGHLPQTSVSITLTPDSLDLAVQTRCDPAMQIEISVNGHGLFESGCGIGPDNARWDQPEEIFGPPGTSLTFTATVTAGYDAEPGQGEEPLPAGGTFAFAVLQRVGFEQYPLPTAPATLASLDEDRVPSRLVVVRADPTIPLRTITGTLTWSSQAELHVLSATPGYLAIEINGFTLAIYEAWDYSGSEYVIRLSDMPALGGPAIADGEVATITVEPRYVTGDWAVWLQPGGIDPSTVQGSAT